MLPHLERLRACKGANGSRYAYSSGASDTFHGGLVTRECPPTKVRRETIGNHWKLSTSCGYTNDSKGSWSIATVWSLRRPQVMDRPLRPETWPRSAFFSLERGVNAQVTSSSMTLISLPPDSCSLLVDRLVILHHHTSSKIHEDCFPPRVSTEHQTI